MRLHVLHYGVEFCSTPWYYPIKSTFGLKKPRKVGLSPGGTF